MFRLVVTVLCFGLLASCVTTMESPFQKNISVEKEVESRVQVAIAYLQDDKPEEAIAQLKIAGEKDPKSARVHEVLALALERTGEYDRALASFKKMLKYEPEYTRGRANYASYLISRNDFSEAKKQLNIVVDDIYYPKRAVAFWQLAQIAGQEQQIPEQKKYLQRAIGLDKRFATAYLGLAEIYYNEKEYAKSYESFNLYRKNVNQSSAKALLLGIKLARIFKDKNEEASYVLALKNLYPKSKEYLEYINTPR